MANGDNENGFSSLEFILSSALAGFGGDTQFSTRFLQQQQEEQERKKREERQKRMDALTAGQALSPVLQGLGLDRFEERRPSESIPLQETEAGGLELNRSEKPSFTTGDEGIDTLLTTFAPGTEKESFQIGRTLAQSALELDQRNFERDLARQIEVIEQTEPIKQKFALQGAIDQFNELEPLRFEADKRRALLNHNLALQRQRAAQMAANAPSPKSTFEALAISEAQQLLDTPRIDQLSVSQYRDVLLRKTMQRWMQFGQELPAEGDILNALNEASRFWNPQLKRLASAAEQPISLDEALAQLQESNARRAAERRGEELP